jgi:hypothetical protein
LGTGLDFCVLHDWIVVKADTFGSILDYVPAIIAPRSAGTLAVRTSTPWGEVDQRIPANLQPLLDTIDGRRNGHALIRTLGASARLASGVARDLLLLRRMRVLTFLAGTGLASGDESDRRSPEWG